MNFACNPFICHYLTIITCTIWSYSPVLILWIDKEIPQSFCSKASPNNQKEHD